MGKAKFTWPEGVKKTKQRESVINVLLAAKKPLSAADIYAEIKLKGENTWLSTVYRILEMLVEKDAVLKTNIAGSEMAVYELNRFEHRHYAVCIKCHKIIPMYSCPMDALIPELKEKNFRVLGHNLEIFGYCKDCNPGK